MFGYARVSILVALALPSLLSCESLQDRERALTDQCKKDTPCKSQGLCTGRCSPEPCVCVVGSAADCEQSTLCSSTGACTAANGKCVIATNTDCARTASCKAAGFCTAKDGTCVVGNDADCTKSELCKNSHKCSAKNGACFDASFNPALLNPALLGDQQVPDKFKVKFATSKGDFVVEVTRAWSPLGAERLLGLVKIGYFANVAFFKADDTGVHFGIHGNPEVTSVWREAMIRDDSAAKQPNDRGYVAFSKTGPNMRWAPLIIHTASNRQLDQVGYAPVGRVVQGMDVIDALAKERVEPGPDPVKLQTLGDGYLKASFPKTAYVTGASLL
jgi:peptidyl-prolyl cis-trans isomerase A (cyclophilin A)